MGLEPKKIPLQKTAILAILLTGGGLINRIDTA
jgi:hypothetical protein